MEKENSKGITLVTLVITIIILLILAGISISALTNTGIFEKTKDAKEKTEQAQKNEQSLLSEYISEMEKTAGNWNSTQKVNEPILMQGMSAIKFPRANR